MSKPSTVLSKRELIENARSDLRHLRDVWSDSVSDEDIRRGCAQLRRLLVDGDLRRAWKETSGAGEPQVSAYRFTDEFLRGRTACSFAYPGGARVGRLTFFGGSAFSRAMSIEEIKSLSQVSAESDMGLSDFVEGPGLVVNGNLIARRMVIKFVANVLGGVHSQTGRLRKKEQAEYDMLESVRNRLDPGGKPLIHFEVLSYGQALTSSQQVVAFMNETA